ncbi:MAG: alpha/beta fold hydrolase [Candidatus Eremiobacteraeota bacterium]|nr:alpha/beta fold hydrolase [Candidatus Eremiobacteraeota bacterium]
MLLPGLVAGKWMWEPTLHALHEAGYGYLTLVGPMAGEHDRAEPITGTVIELMDRCGIGSAALVGGSFGSLIALDCALRFPQRASMVALSGAPGMFTARDVAAPFKGKATRTFGNALVDRLFFDRRCAPEYGVNETMMLFQDQRRLAVAARLMRESNHYDYAAALSKIDARVLMIWGADDCISPCRLWESHLAPSARRGMFFKIQRCGHVPMIERPRIFNALLMDQLASAPLGRFGHTS